MQKAVKLITQVTIVYLVERTRCAVFLSTHSEAVKEEREKTQSDTFPFITRPKTTLDPEHQKRTAMHLQCTCNSLAMHLQCTSNAPAMQMFGMAK